MLKAQNLGCIFLNQTPIYTVTELRSIRKSPIQDQVDVKSRSSPNESETESRSRLKTIKSFEAMPLL